MANVTYGDYTGMYNDQGIRKDMSGPGLASQIPVETPPTSSTPNTSSTSSTPPATYSQESLDSYNNLVRSPYNIVGRSFVNVPIGSKVRVNNVAYTHVLQDVPGGYRHYYVDSEGNEGMVKRLITGDANSPYKSTLIFKPF